MVGGYQPFSLALRKMTHGLRISGHDALLGDFVSKTTVAKKDWFSLGTISVCYFCTANLLLYPLLELWEKLLGFQLLVEMEEQYEEEVILITKRGFSVLHGPAQSSWSLRTCRHSANTGPEIAPVRLFRTWYQRNSKAYSSLQQYLVGNGWGLEGYSVF